MKINNRRSPQENFYTQCPVIQTLQIFGGKWKPVILWEMERGSLRFGALRKSIPGITQKMLTQQLRELETDGIIWRKVFAEVPPHVEYGITDYGKTLRPILDEMARWGMTHKKKCSDQGVTNSSDEKTQNLILDMQNS